MEDAPICWACGLLLLETELQNPCYIGSWFDAEFFRSVQKYFVVSVGKPDAD
jgi:hypothetical protein